MPKLGERFESLSRAPAPDLWHEIEGREPRNPIEPSSARRVVAAVVALVVGIAGIGIAAATFGGADRPAASGASGPVAIANGPIYFRVGGAEGGSRIESIEPDGSGRRVVFPDDPDINYDRISFSPDGTRIAFDNYLVDEYGIETANPDGSEVVRLTDGVNDSWASWSPDGTRILFSSTRYDPGIEGCEPGFPHEYRCPTDIYVMDVDGSNVVRLTDDPAGEFMPRWSPDGSLIAFVREGDLVAGTYEAIYTMRSDGTEVRQVSSASGGSDFWPSWSPDGTQIVFAAIRKEDWGIWAVDADGSNERLILGGIGAGNVDDPVWSPDGDLIAFVGNLSVDDYSPEDALYVMRPDGTGVTPIADAPGTGVAGDVAWQPVLVSGDGEEPPSPPTRAQVVDTFSVGRDVRSVAYAEGSVWVAVSNGDGSSSGRIVRIDPATHDVQAEIPVGVVPIWEVGGGAMVFADGDLWVAGTLEKLGGPDSPGGGADAAVVRIDPSTNEVVQEYAMGGTGAADFTFLDGDLWVLLFGDHGMEVVRVDTETGDVSPRYQLDANWAHTIVTAEGRLVTGVGGDGAVNVNGRVLELDPATGAISAVDAPSRTSTPMPVLWRGQVWLSTDPGFVWFDPLVEGFPEPPVTLPPRFGDCCGFLEADDRGIWFLSPDVEGGTDLNVFDPATGEATALVAIVEGTPVAMAVAPDSVWILNYEGTLTHVDLG